MDIGLYTDSLSRLPFERALDVAADSGVRSIEIATGGQSSAPHLALDDLLENAPARARFLAAFAGRGLRIAALNCSAWPMHPVLGEAHSRLIDKTLRLASELGVSKIVSMSGCPGDGAAATTVNWIWYPWPDDAVALARRSWDEAIAMWTAKVRLAETCGVTRIAFELHPLHVVYNVPTVLAFRAEVGDRIGVNLDPRHLIWQQMDPIAVARALGPAVFHVHMKDTEVQADQVALAGVLDDGRSRLRTNEPGSSGRSGGPIPRPTGPPSSTPSRRPATTTRCRSSRRIRMRRRRTGSARPPGSSPRCWKIAPGGPDPTERRRPRGGPLFGRLG